MEINGDHNVIQPIDGKMELPKQAGAGAGKKRSAGDTVEISRDARQLHTQDPAAPEPGAGSERMKTEASRMHAEVQRRMKSGFYESQEVLDGVARRILEFLGL